MAIFDLGYDPNQVQGYVNFIWYIAIAIVFFIIIGYLLLKFWKVLTYKIHITFHEKLGKAIVSYDDFAREFKEDNNFYLHYKGINKLSPLFDAKYQTIYKKRSFFGLMNKTYRSYNLFRYGKKIVPMMVADNPGIQAMDMDLFNFMQSRIQINAKKYQRNNMLLQLAPLIGIGMVVLMFILGMIFYTKHVETISANILKTTAESVSKIINSAGIQQING